MPSKPQCWIASYVHRRAPNGARSPSSEGLLTIPKDAAVALLHTHPGGARLAHAAAPHGLSPGKRVEIGEYDVELLMLAPHGGGGNPAYAAAFARPGEPLPTMTPYKEEGWLTWLGLDDVSNDTERVVLRAPALPNASDAQPTTPIAFAAYAEGAYERRRSEREAYENERMETRDRARIRDDGRVEENARYVPERPSAARAHTVGAAAMAAHAPAAREPARAAPAREPAPARRRESVFHDEYLDHDEEKFKEDVRFEAAPERVREVEPPTTRGTRDEMEALRAKLAELERLTGTTSEEAERALEADLMRARELVPDLVITKVKDEEVTRIEAAPASAPPPEPEPKRAPPEPEIFRAAATSAPKVIAYKAPEVQVPARVIPQHEAVIEVPPAVSVSANIFKAKASALSEPATSPKPQSPKPQGSGRIGVVETESLPAVRAPSAHAPVVRETARADEPLASTPTPSVATMAVTPEEVDANDAWAAAVARRNRSVDDDSIASSAVVDTPTSPAVRAPSAHAPVVRASARADKPLAPTPTPSVVAVTPEEVDANDAWAAAVARRNRSVDDDSSSSSDNDDDDDGPSRVLPPTIVRVVAASKTSSPTPSTAVSSRAAAFERTSASHTALTTASIPSTASIVHHHRESKPNVFPTASPRASPPAAAPAPALALDDVSYVSGAVAARARAFGEQTKRK